MTEVVIVAAKRTAVGKFGGSLAKIAAADLGAHVIRGLLAQTGIGTDKISEVILGQVLTAGVGQNAARQALIVPVSGRKWFAGSSVVTRSCIAKPRGMIDAWSGIPTSAEASA